MSVAISEQRYIQCSAARAAPAVLEWLASDTPTRPFHIFAKVCNVINADGNVISLMLAPAEMNPLALELDCPEQLRDFTEHIQSGSDVRHELDLLSIGGLAIRLHSPETWDPFPDWSAARANRQHVQNLIGDISSILIANLSTDSLAVFLREVDSFSDPTISGWQKRAGEPIKRLLDGLATGDTPAVLAGAAALAGLGMGLTPSGDDFIIGVMHALWCTSPPEDARRLCGEILKAVATKTNRLSASYLARSACGEAGEAWHTLIEGMTRGDAAAIRSPVDTLIGHGHTSGQDALSGFVLACQHLQALDFIPGLPV